MWSVMQAAKLGMAVALTALLVTGEAVAEPDKIGEAQAIRTSVEGHFHPFLSLMVANGLVDPTICRAKLVETSISNVAAFQHLLDIQQLRRIDTASYVGLLQAFSGRVAICRLVSGDAAAATEAWEALVVSTHEGKAGYDVRFLQGVDRAVAGNPDILWQVKAWEAMVRN
jgi:hypothetical protein